MLGRWMFVAAAVVGLAGLARGEEAPGTFSIDGRGLLETRRRVMAKEAGVADAIARIRRDADKALRGTLWAVTDKTVVAPSGDKHDYVSLATYYWPNPDKADGLPYVHRDGEVNPEGKEYDVTRLGGMCTAVRSLTLAYYLTGEEAYAERAAKQLRTWFLDEATRMNPHLKYSQMVKGRNQGSRVGIIDTWRLPWVVDGSALLQGSKSWTAEDQAALTKWFADFLEWLRSSEPGKQEMAATNNHGTWFDVQTASFALMCGQKELAREIVEKAKAERIAKQIEPDGSQPREMARTRSLTYTFFNLNAMFQLAQLGDRAGVDLWNYRTEDGRSIRSALDWLVPYASGKKEWGNKQITQQNYGGMVPLLRQAGIVYKEPGYEKLIGELKNLKDEVLWADVLYPGGKKE